MNSQSKQPDGSNEEGAAPGAGCESLLRAEIAFWRELLSECDRFVPAASVERMRQALALAEHRLLQICQDRPAGTASGPAPLWTGVAGRKFVH